MDKKLYDVCDFARIEAIVYADIRDVKEILGAHVCSKGVLINMYMPEAKSVCLVIKGSGKRYTMEKVDEAGFFSILLENTKKIPKDYSYRVTFKDGSEKEILDMYSFDCFISKEDLIRFRDGVSFNAYTILGAHPKEVNKIRGTYFTVWAPNALGVRLVGDFNNYDGCAYLMNEIDNTGVFELFVPDVNEGAKYMFEIHAKGDKFIRRIDPYSFFIDRQNNMSVVTDLRNRIWSDYNWMDDRKNIDDIDSSPMFIYELHLETFAKGVSSYRELAHIIANYVVYMGYTHIELLPIMEYEREDTFGYDTIGYFSPTNRYGSQFDFMYFVEYMHKNNIGVILEWIPSYFSNMENGLKCFDGSNLYEYSDNKKSVHAINKNRVFDYGKNQVCNFLLSSMYFWFEKYHIDGIRVIDVSSMLYLDYGRNSGEWIPNTCGGNENFEAIDFIKKMNKINKKRKDKTFIIADETSLWKKVTDNISNDGLGFDYKWNVEWTKDTIDYMMCDPLFRKGRHCQLTDGMLYFYSERFLTTLSHDLYKKFNENIFNKLPGEEGQVFANIKAIMAYMVTYPGKKLIFMGLDYMNKNKWSYDKSMEISIVDGKIIINNEKSSIFNLFMKKLIAMYRRYKALFCCDYISDGFKWINDMDVERSIISFLRCTDNGEENLLVLCNFTPVVYEGYTLGVPFDGIYEEIFSSDSLEFGGEGYINEKGISAKRGECDGRDYFINIVVPPMAVAVFKIDTEF